jgi:two-component system sensor histidine kinase PilS (NtrC family)
LLGLPAAPESLAECSPSLVIEHLNRRDRGIESEATIQLPQSGRSLRVRFLPPGEGGNTLIFLEDVGRQQQEAQQLKLAALGRLTANMAHEIRNPLASISHAAELLADDPDARADRLIRIIGDNTQRLNRLVIEVMELGRRDRASPERIELPGFLSGLIDEMTLQNPLDPARIDVQLPPGQSIVFDRGHLHRVLGNLLGNALVFASAGPAAIHLFGEPDVGSGRFFIHIIDDGPGIDAITRNQIFEPFFTTRSAGTGLGLYIARELCEANSAQLFLLENAPGAHFCLSCVSTWPDQNKNPTAT